MEWWDIVSMFFQRHIVFRWIVIDMNGMPELDCIDLIGHCTTQWATVLTTIYGIYLYCGAGHNQ